MRGKSLAPVAALAAAILATLGAAAGSVSAATLANTAGALGAPAISPNTERAGSAVASVSPAGATIGDRQVALRLAFEPRGGVAVTGFSDRASGRDWALPGSPEFSLTLDSAPTSSLQGWRLIGASVFHPSDPARPDAGEGVALELRYALAGAQPPGTAGGLVELDRTWTLYPGDGSLAVSEQLINTTPAVLRVGTYTLAEVTSPVGVTAEVRAYHGGSDWRQDFDVPAAAQGTFDREGEVVRFDDGSGAGWFFVGVRRGGVMNRVGRTSSGETYMSVDNAQDLFDWGPLMSSPPGYNTLANPAYPAPVRQRTLTPFGTLDLGEAYAGVYSGGAQQAAAAFAGAFAAHSMAAGSQTVDLNSFHPWEHGPGMADANLRPQAAQLAKAGGEVFMLDDQWQGSSAGDWQWDTARFPISGSDGVPDFVKYLHSLGLQLGLWMSPAEFNPGSAAYQSNPQWACTPTGHATAQVKDDSGLGVWDMTNPQLQDHLSSVIDRLISQDGVREFKFDYVTWVDCPPHDYLDYEDAYVNWVHRQQVAHPGVTFELDETNDQRLWPFRSAALGPSWFDNGHLQGDTYPARLLHDVFAAAPWLPPSSLGFGLYDDSDLAPPYTVDYLMPIALLGHVTFWTDMTKLSDQQIGETAWWTGWYRAHREALGGLVYEDTTSDPVDGKSFVAFQPWRCGHGFVFAFSQSAGGMQTIALHGLRPGARYQLADVRNGEELGTFAGSQLMRGIGLDFGPYQARVLSVDPVR